MLKGQGWRVEQVEVPGRKAQVRLRVEGSPDFQITADATLVELPEGFVAELFRLAQSKASS